LDDSQAIEKQLSYGSLNGYFEKIAMIIPLTAFESRITWDLIIFEYLNNVLLWKLP